jgi:hypothetical protein
MEGSQVTTVVSVVGGVVGLIALTVAWSQMRIASAKIKLDLYNKRFNIYLATLDYYQSAYEKTQEDMKVKAIAFIKSYRESLFLFDSKDGIYKTLERIKDSGAAISTNKEANADNNWPLRHDQQAMYQLHQRSIEAYTQLDKDLKLLEKQLAKYINFRVVRGWTFWRDNGKPFSAPKSN